MAENRKVEIYADLLPEEYFLITKDDIGEEFIYCPICKQEAIFESGKLKLRGESYLTYTCDNCGESFYGELLNSGAIKLRFYSDTEKIDNSKDIQDQLNQYLINHKSVNAYKTTKVKSRENDTDLVHENLDSLLHESYQYGDYVITDTEFGYVVTKNNKVLADFATDTDAEEYIDTLRIKDNPTRVNRLSLDDRVKLLSDCTGLLLLPIHSNLVGYVEFDIESNLYDKSIQRKIDNYNKLYDDNVQFKVDGRYGSEKYIYVRE